MAPGDIRRSKQSARDQFDHQKTASYNLEVTPQRSPALRAGLYTSAT